MKINNESVYIGNLYFVTNIENGISPLDRQISFKKFGSLILVYKKKDKYYDYNTNYCYKDDGDSSLHVGDVFLDTKDLLSFEKFYQRLSENVSEISKGKMLKMFYNNQNKNKRHS